MNKKNWDGARLIPSPEVLLAVIESKESEGSRTKKSRSSSVKSVNICQDGNPMQCQTW